LDIITRRKVQSSKQKRGLKKLPEGVVVVLVKPRNPLSFASTNSATAWLSNSSPIEDKEF